MSITTYSELKTAIGAWRSRNDLSTIASDFVSLAEAKLNRKLRTRWQESALTATPVDASFQIAIPATAVAIKGLWRDGSPVDRVEQKTLDYVITHQQAGRFPSYYAWSGANWVFDGDALSVEGVYYIKIPALSDSATTNWLLTSHPDIYLWACLEQACIYLRDPEGATAYQAMWTQAADELNSVSIADQISGGKLVATFRR